METSLYKKKDWELASDMTLYNKPILSKSKMASCYSCISTFPVTEIKEFVDMNDDTALCPKCGIDAVLGDATDLPIHNLEYLQAMHNFGFK